MIDKNEDIELNLTQGEKHDDQEELFTQSKEVEAREPEKLNLKQQQESIFNTVEDVPTEKLSLVKEDEGSINPKPLLITLGAIAMIGALGFGGYKFMTMNDVLVPNVVGASAEVSTVWADKNNISLTITYQQRDDYPVNVVINQSVEPDTTIKKGDAMTITVTKAKDVIKDDEAGQGSLEPEQTPETTPDIQSPIPDIDDIIGMHKSTVDKWVKDNNLKVTYVTRYNDNVDKEYTISASDIKNNALTVYMSKGQLSITDFTGKNIVALEKWAKAVNGEGAAIKIVKNEVVSDSVPGTILKQSPAKAKITASSTITVDVAVLQALMIDDYIKKPLSGLEKWASDNKLKVEVVKVFNDDIPVDFVIKQSPGKGEVKEGDTIFVEVSIGKFNIPDYKYKTLNHINEDLVTFAKQGVNVTVVSREIEDAKYAAGTILEQRYDSGVLHVSVAITPARVSIEDLVGLTIEQAVLTQTCSSNFTCKFEAINTPGDGMKPVIISHDTGDKPKGSTITIKYQYQA